MDEEEIVISEALSDAVQNWRAHEDPEFILRVQKCRDRKWGKQNSDWSCQNEILHVDRFDLSFQAEAIYCFELVSEEIDYWNESSEEADVEETS